MSDALVHAYEQLDKKQAEINRLEGVCAALRGALLQIQSVNSSLQHDENISFIWLRDLCDKVLNPPPTDYSPEKKT